MLGLEQQVRGAFLAPQGGPAAGLEESIALRIRQPRWDAYDFFLQTGVVHT
jgi:hypothetical protein